LCCECYASFAIEAFDESSSVAQAEAKKIESMLMTAITNGELQQELDTINPDTPVRIEEGHVRQRDDPAGVCYRCGDQCFNYCHIPSCCCGGNSGSRLLMVELSGQVP
jgi:hypothetical protein